MPENLAPYLEFIAETAYLAGRLALGYFHSATQTELKADDTPVTAADRAAEQFIRRRIESRFPRQTILGEEFGLQDAASSHRWLIDPIDGTKSFIHGVPLFGVLIGLEIDGCVEVGAAYFPALDEMLTAASGLGCWLNGRRAHVSRLELLDRAVMAFTSPKNFYVSGKVAPFERLVRATYFQGGWGDAYGYCLVATGRVELMVDPLMNAWDCAPFPPILREAGGYFGDWRGHATIYGGEALGVSQALLPAVLPLLEMEPV